MNIFFDVDYTILGQDDSLRPRTREVFRKLTLGGHRLYLWSGHGIRWGVVRKHRLRSFILDCFPKPLGGFGKAIGDLGIPCYPDFVVDDYPEIPAAFGGIWVRPYFTVDRSDREMDLVYDVICEFIQTGNSSNNRFRPKPS